jgi:hypothetical protein
MNLDERRKERVVELAQEALTQERHWAIVGSEDRAETGKCLAEAILDLLGIPEDECPAGCKECEEHEENVE